MYLKRQTIHQSICKLIDAVDWIVHCPPATSRNLNWTYLDAGRKHVCPPAVCICEAMSRQVCACKMKSFTHPFALKHYYIALVAFHP